MTTKIPKSKAKTAYGLLSEIRKLILAEPLRYNQKVFIDHPDDPNVAHDQWPSCGTVGCVAGWVATLKGKQFTYEETPDVARCILGLDLDLANFLFSGSTFVVGGVPQTKEHAKAGAAHIYKFQREHAKQLKAKRVGR